MKLLLFALLAVAARAQSVEGSVANAATGAPLFGVTVQLHSDATGKDVAQVVTDGQGVFRIESAAPGRYTVVYKKPGFITRYQDAVVTASGVRLDMRLTQRAAISGRVLDSNRHPVQNARVQLLFLGINPATVESTNARGEFVLRDLEPGRYALAAIAPDNLRPPSSRTWVRTYYPGADRAEAASTLIVGPGGDLAGYDIVLLSVPARRLRGRVLDPNGDPVPAAEVKLFPFGAWIIEAEQLQTRADENGAFEFPSIHDGRWRLDVNSANPKLAAITRLDIASDVDRFELRLKPPISVTGDVFRALPIGVVLLPPGGHFYTGKVDHGFRIDGVTEGEYSVVTSILPPPYYLASVRLGEREVRGETFELHSGALPITVTLKNDVGAVRGSVENCTKSMILLLPQDPQLLPLDFVRQAACGVQGAFDVRNVPPGYYYAYAFTERPSSLEYPRFITPPATNDSVRVTVRPNEATLISLKLTPRE
jgi:hypothetical protein